MGSTSSGSGQIVYSVDRRSKNSADLGVLGTIGVFYLCPQLGPELLSKEEWMEKVEAHILKQMEKNRPVGSCLMIRTYNSEKDASLCVDLLCTYLTNILEHPKSERFRNIAFSNKTFSEKVTPIKGAMEFLLVAGFKAKTIKTTRSVEECLVLEGNVDTVFLENLVKTLRSVQPIKLNLDRNPRVYKAGDTKSLETSDDFFKLTVEEVRSEQKKRTESVKSAAKLMTKAMREVEQEKSKKPVKNYAYSLIRIRFPDGIYLQGTFEVKEPLNEVRQFVTDCLAAQVPFELLSSLGKPFSQNDYQTPIDNLNLVPAVVLNIQVKAPAKKLTIKEDLIKKMKKL